MAQQHINYSFPNDGLGDPLRQAFVKTESNFNELYANKVDKIVGKGLSDTNYTQAEKDKLAGLTEGGQIQSDWDQGDAGEVDFIKNKPVNTSDFNNDGDGTQAFVTDNPSAAPSARINGSWVALSDFLVPKMQFTADGVQDTFSIGVAATIKAVFWNSALLNDADWSQTGTTFTLTFIPTAGDLIKPI